MLPHAAAEVLTDTDSLNYLAPLARMFSAAAIQLPALLTAYRTGGGVGWAQFGTDMRESQADMNRPWFEHALPGALASVSDLDSVLRRPGARIADIGTGAGWSAIALARAYPDARVEGFDIDAPSIDLAKANARGAGLGDKIGFHVTDAAGLADQPEPFDAAFAFECVHDMPYPVEVLAATRAAVRLGAPVIVMDEAVRDSFQVPGDETEKRMYGFSTLVCLPDGMAREGSVGTGTVMRVGTLRDYARAAGRRRRRGLADRRLRILAVLPAGVTTAGIRHLGSAAATVGLGDLTLREALAKVPAVAASGALNWRALREQRSGAT